MPGHAPTGRRFAERIGRLRGAVRVTFRSARAVLLTAAVGRPFDATA